MNMMNVLNYDELSEVYQNVKKNIVLGVLVIFGYQSTNWFWTFNLWTLNFYSWEGKKVSKNHYEIKVQGLVSNREGVKHPKRLWYFEGASCLNYLVLITCLFIGKILPKV